jgi:SAM-dependent methyltransferase
MAFDKDAFEKQMQEAWQHEFAGWDFQYISGRIVEAPLSWDYKKLALERIRNAKSLLDLDTGGGEFLAALQPLPPGTCATECYPPNIPVATAKLEPLGVKVISTHAAITLPFEPSSFDLILNRHGGILGSEIARILKAGGRFLTQQVGDRNCLGLNEALQNRPDFIISELTAERAAKQLEAAGLKILERKEEFPKTDFKDIGAVVYYLKAIPWQVSDFSIEKYYDRLAEIQQIIQEKGAFTVQAHRFLIEAQKP